MRRITSAQDVLDVVENARREWWAAWTASWRRDRPTLDPRPEDLEAALRLHNEAMWPIEEWAARALRDGAFPIQVPKEGP